MEAACILTCVGSLTTARIRLANCPEATEFHGHFEIVSLEGTLSRRDAHMHIAFSDGTGKTIGGHLLHGCRVYTTTEIVIGELPEYRFLRTHDPETGYPELEIHPATCDKE